MAIAVGLIGFGRFGQHYARLLQALPAFELKAVVATQPASFSVDKIRLGPTVARLTEPAVVFNDTDIAAVVIATPPSTHFSLAVQALKAGKHILLEKPMVTSLEQAVQLQPLVSQSRSIFMVGLQYVYNPAVQYLKAGLTAQELGPFEIMDSIMAQLPIGPDVAVVDDAGPHPLSIFQYLFEPTELRHITGWANPGEAELTLEFDRGPRLKLNFKTEAKVKVRQLILTGRSTKLVIDETLVEHKLSLEPAVGPKLYPPLDPTEVLAKELAAFAQAIRTGRAPLTDFNFGLKITQYLGQISQQTDT